MSFLDFGKAVTYLFVRIAFRMRYEGLENIPRDQGFILAGNHRSVIDPLFIAHKVPQKLNFMAKVELFKNPLFGWILRHLNAFPVDRGKGDNGAIEEAQRRINAGGVLVMFIEGHRSKDGVLQRPRSGVALIAGQTGCDVLPCAVVYGKKLGFRTTVTVRYASLIKNGRLAADPSSPTSLRTASRTVMDEIARLIDAGPQTISSP